MKRRHSLDEPRVFMFDDGRHAASLYQFEPPLEPSDFTFNVDQLADSGVDTLIYFAVLEGGIVMYDSRVAQKWGDNVVKWTHTVWYRAGRNIHQLVADGYDPLKLLCDRCHEKGIWFIPSNPVTLSGGDRATDGGLGRKSDFVYEHPEFQVGEEEDPRASDASVTRFSFLHPEVRAERFQVSEELLARYETDGIELNMTDFVPFCRFDEVEELAPIMTQWIRDLRAVARNAEADQGRRKRIYVRIPAHPDAWSALGYDVPGWVSEGLVDGLICQPGLTQGPVDQDPDLSGAVALVSGTQCRVLASFQNVLSRQLKQYATPPMIWAAAANAYAQGTDGFGIGDAHWTPNGWPWTHDEYQTLRLLGHPEMLATADKLYRVRSETRGVTKGVGWAPGVAPSLPQTLVEGEPVEVRLRISDELEKWGALGRVEAVQLRIRMIGIEPLLNEVRIELNGQPLPDTILDIEDLNYRLISTGAVGPYGQVYKYQLSPAYYPKPGHNTVRITLVKRDPNIENPFEVYDVDCDIRYRLHRHFGREPIDY